MPYKDLQVPGDAEPVALVPLQLTAYALAPAQLAPLTLIDGA
jgi:hypothetical protein